MTEYDSSIKSGLSSAALGRYINMSAQSPYLDTLLSKLRPFQRSAFEFAVYGTTEEDNLKSKKNYNNYGAPKQVAGAGTGRILLGDEMGLGYVLIC